jgi:DMSO/TMAO reductase YedYZ molybdopterin-dependent catalytic subunit
MKKLTEGLAAAFGLLAGAAVVAVTYLGHRAAALPYLPFDVFDWQARALPGGLIAHTIDAMVAVIRGLRLGPTASTAKIAEQGFALAQFTGAWLIFGIVLAAVGKRKPRRLTLYGAVGGVILFAAAAGIEGARGFAGTKPGSSLPWLALVLIGGGALLGRALAAVAEPFDASASNALGRRRFLRLVGTGSFAVIVTAAGVSLLSKKDAKPPLGTDQDELLEAAKTSGPAASPPPDELAKRFAPVPGTRREVTKTSEFYRIDINLRPPEIDGASWRLKLGGLVERPLTLSLDDIRSRPRQTQALTLSCISNPVGGDLISTGFWTGTPFKGILDEAGLKPGVVEIAIESADDFYESVPLEEALDPRTLLVYDMNGRPLTVDHGFPLRIFIPGHFGMKQPKWITRMEAIDRQRIGYWVERNWSERAPVLTTSVIDAVVLKNIDPASPLVPVGGIAYSGARGISRVEVRADNGPWEKAELREPALGPLTWVQWRYDWKAAPGKHVLQVRAYDGTGQAQVESERGTYPDGATGLHSRSADIRR